MSSYIRRVNDELKKKLLEAKINPGFSIRPEFIPEGAPTYEWRGDEGTVLTLYKVQNGYKQIPLEIVRNIKDLNHETTYKKEPHQEVVAVTATILCFPLFDASESLPDGSMPFVYMVNCTGGNRAAFKALPAAKQYGMTMQKLQEAETPDNNIFPQVAGIGELQRDYNKQLQNSIANKIWQQFP